MRQNTKIIMLLTAALFFALMIFQWGMDISGRSAGSGDLGRVGRTPVGFEEYQATYRNLYDQIQRSQASSISRQQNREIEDLAFQEVVNQILIRNELERRGIVVTDEEIRQAALYAPPPEFRSDPAFQNEAGEFDLARYQQYLGQAGQDPLFLLQLEQYYRDMIPREKLARQVTSGIYVSDAELWELWRSTTETVEVTYLSVDPGTRIPDADVAVSQAEIEAYYEANREDFAVPARATVRYAVLDKTPTAADSAATLEAIRALRSEIVGGAEFGAVAIRESEDPGSAPAGGHLGEVRRGDLLPALDSLVFSLPVGQVSEPVLTPAGYHLVETTVREGEIAEARHILLRIERDPESEFALLAAADSLEALGEVRTLDAAAREFGLPVLEGTITDESAFLPQVGNASEGQDWIFLDEEGVGAISPVFEAELAFYMVEIVGLAPAGYLGLDEVSASIGADLRAARKRERVLEEARGWAAELRSGATTLESLSDRIGVPLAVAGPFTRQETVPGLGFRTPAIGAAFGTAVGRTAGPVMAGEMVVLLRVEDRVDADREVWEAQKESQRNTVTQMVRQSRLVSWIDGLRETTRIQDRRDDYFRAAEAQQERASRMPNALGY